MTIWRSLSHHSSLNFSFSLLFFLSSCSSFQVYKKYEKSVLWSNLMLIFKPTSGRGDLKSILFSLHSLVTRVQRVLKQKREFMKYLWKERRLMKYGGEVWDFDRSYLYYIIYSLENIRKQINNKNLNEKENSVKSNKTRKKIRYIKKEFVTKLNTQFLLFFMQLAMGHVNGDVDFHWFWLLDLFSNWIIVNIRQKHYISFKNNIDRFAFVFLRFGFHSLLVWVS